MLFRKIKATAGSRPTKFNFLSRETASQPAILIDKQLDPLGQQAAKSARQDIIGKKPRNKVQRGAK